MVVPVPEEVVDYWLLVETLLVSMLVMAVTAVEVEVALSAVVAVVIIPALEETDSQQSAFIFEKFI